VKPNAEAIPKSSSATAPVVLREEGDGVCLLTLNRPQMRNALSEEVLSELSQALVSIASSSSARAVVLAANGPAFCSGHDLKELTLRRSDPDGGRAYFEQIFAACGDVMQAIIRLPQPVVAAVQGTASAAGCELVACCDLAVASSLASFCTPGVDIGLFCSTPMVPLSRNLTRKHAMEMLLTGDMINVVEAHRFGLINRVVAAGTERAEAIKIARQIASKSAMTMRMGKEAFYRQLDMTLDDAFRHARRVMVDNLLKRDAIEGIGAFLDKRPAKWEDR
jgi:enoyl-CoA hydratase/carnithine racemase